MLYKLKGETLWTTREKFPSGLILEETGFEFKVSKYRTLPRSTHFKVMSKENELLLVSPL